MMDPAGTLETRPPSDARDRRSPLTPRRGLVGGLGAGVVAIGCCVGPTVAALFGVMSAAAAADLALDLFEKWGWAFKAAGIAAGIAALLIARRQARACRIGQRSLIRFALVLATSGIATYFALYALTTWLGEVAV